MTNSFEQHLEKLEQIRQNNSNVKSLCAGDWDHSEDIEIPNDYGTLLGEALQHNTHLQELDLSRWTIRLDQNIDKVLLFIQ